MSPSTIVGKGDNGCLRQCVAGRRMCWTEPMRKDLKLVGQNPMAVLVTALAVAASVGIPLRAQSANTINITGVVKSASGESVTGALVKVRSEASGLAFIVVTQEEGRYSTPNLLPGKYIVQGFGGSVESQAAGPVDVSNARQAKVDLVLNASLQVPQRERRMVDADYEKLLPPGPGKADAADRCSSCHSLMPVVSARKTREEWQHTFDRMVDDVFDLRKLMIYHQKSENGDIVLDYLAKNFGPDRPVDPQVAKQWLLRRGSPSHPNRNLPASLLKGTAAKYIAMEFSLPAGAEARDIAVDSHGIAWVSEKHTGMVGQFDPRTLTYTRLSIPAGKNPELRVDAIQVDTQDQVWFADDGPNGRIIQYNPTSRQFNTYQMPGYRFDVPPNQGWARIETLRVANGNVWAVGTSSNRILRLDLNTQRFTDYSIPKGSVAYGLVIGPNSTPWYSAVITNVIVNLDPKTSKLTKYYVPLEEKERADLRGLAADGDGNFWVGASEIGKLLKLDGHSQQFTEYTPPTTDAGVFAVDVDTKRNLVWFSEVFADRIGRFDPRDKSFVEFPQPSSDTDVRRIEVDRSRPNRVWWAGDHSGKIGYVETLE
jgi:streptogramin lyase